MGTRHFELKSPAGGSCLVRQSKREALLKVQKECSKNGAEKTIERKIVVAVWAAFRFTAPGGGNYFVFSRLSSVTNVPAWLRDARLSKAL